MEYLLEYQIRLPSPLPKPDENIWDADTYPSMNGRILLRPHLLLFVIHLKELKPNENRPWEKFPFLWSPFVYETKIKVMISGLGNFVKGIKVFSYQKFFVFTVMGESNFLVLELKLIVFRIVVRLN